MNEDERLKRLEYKMETLENNQESFKSQLTRLNSNIDKFLRWAEGSNLNNGIEKRMRKQEQFRRNIQYKLYGFIGGIITLLGFLLYYII